MTEQTLFDMQTPQQKAREEAKATKATRSKSWFPKTISELLARGYIHGAWTNCKACNKLIRFWKTPTGKVIPIDEPNSPEPSAPAIPHWSTCTDPNRFRKARSK